MKRVRDLHLFLAGYQKQKGDENAREDDDDGGFLSLADRKARISPIIIEATAMTTIR